MKQVIRGLAVIAIGSLAVLSLAGCIDNTVTPTNAPTTPATSTSPYSSSPTPMPTAAATPTPVTLPCTTVLTAQQVYDYNPNYVAKDPYKPAAGTDSATVVADRGVACGWVDETSGSILSVAIAQPAASELAHLESAASASSSPDSVAAGATGYFSVSGGVGELQVFTSTYWVVIASADFAAVGDVQPTGMAVIGNIESH